MSDYQAPHTRLSPQELAERHIADFNKARATRGKPPLTQYEIEKRAGLERVYRTSFDPAEKQAAMDEMQQQDRAEQAPPASAAAIAEHRAKIDAILNRGGRPKPVPPAEAPTGIYAPEPEPFDGPEF